MTKKKIGIIASIACIALILGVISVYAIRNINEKPPIVVEQKVDNTMQSEGVSETPTTILSTTFTGVDVVHWGKGTAEIVKSQDGVKLSFKDNFEVAQGPDLFVYLSPNAAGQELGEFASLGNLKATKGMQEYDLPENYKDYKTVIIWCRAFGVTFATASLE